MTKVASSQSSEGPCSTVDLLLQPGLQSGSCAGGCCMDTPFAQTNLEMPGRCLGGCSQSQGQASVQAADEVWRDEVSEKVRVRHGKRGRRSSRGRVSGPRGIAKIAARRFALVLHLHLQAPHSVAIRRPECILHSGYLVDRELQD